MSSYVVSRFKVATGVYFVNLIEVSFPLRGGVTILGLKPHRGGNRLISSDYRIYLNLQSVHCSKRQEPIQDRDETRTPVT